MPNLILIFCGGGWWTCRHPIYAKRWAPYCHHGFLSMCFFWDMNSGFQNFGGFCSMSNKQRAIIVYRPTQEYIYIIYNFFLIGLVDGKWFCAIQVRRRSVIEMKEFLRRWRNAVKTDPDWIDPYQTFNESSPGYHEDARY
jgi:hypothetical protein